MRLVGEEIGAELPIQEVVPDFAERPLEQIAQDQALVIVGGEGRDAARQAIAVGCDVGRRPGPQTGLPWAIAGRPAGRQALAQIARAGGAKVDAQRGAQRFTFGDEISDDLGQLAVEQRHADAVEHCPPHGWELPDNRGELVEGQGAQRLAGEVGSRAGLAEQIAARLCYAR